MAILDVLPYPNPFLRHRAQEVETFDDDLKVIINDMIETMAEQDGIGLAATQVGIDKRVLILSPYAFEGEAGQGKPDLVVINPEIVWESDRGSWRRRLPLLSWGLYQVSRPSRCAFEL